MNQPTTQYYENEIDIKYTMKILAGKLLGAKKFFPRLFIVYLLSISF